MIDEAARLEFNRGTTRARNAYQAKFCENGDGQLRLGHPSLCPTCARRIVMARASATYRAKKKAKT